MGRRDRRNKSPKKTSDTKGDSRPKPDAATDCEPTEVSEIVFQHLRRTREIEDKYYEIYIDKAHKFLMIHLALFAGMSFAFGQLEWIENASISLIWIARFLAILAAVALGFAFLCGLQCLRIGKAHIVGVEGLKKLLEDDQIKNFSQYKMRVHLSRNIVNSIIDQRDDKQASEGWSNWLNRLTFVGFLLVAMFVMVVTISKSFVPVGPSELGVTSMNDSGDTNTTPQAPNDGNTQPSPSGPPSDSPSAVEPGTTTQRDGSSLSAVEKGTTIPCSQGRSKDGTIRFIGKLSE